jgi:peptidoglycan/xylan/chitin deacetylase (PgdA/CDA1 family)
MIWRLLSSAASPPGARASLTVLFFHRVLPAPDALLPDEPTPPLFQDMLRWIGSQFQVLPLLDAVRRLDDGSLPAAAAAITFDDGYRDNLEIAAPLLQQHGMPATFFLTSAFLDGGLMWNDRVIEALRASPRERLVVRELDAVDLDISDMAGRRAAIVRLLQRLKYLPAGERDRAVDAVVSASGVQSLPALMMNRSEVRELAQRGFTVGAHTVTHPILTQLPDAEAAREIGEGRRALEETIQRDVRLFAYPNGREGIDFDERHREMARAAGFEAAFTTDAGVCGAASDRWRLPRFTPWDRSERRFRMQLLRNQFRKTRDTRTP